MLSALRLADRGQGLEGGVPSTLLPVTCSDISFTAAIPVVGNGSLDKVHDA